LVIGLRRPGLEGLADGPKGKRRLLALSGLGGVPHHLLKLRDRKFLFL
jgi:hypothetical protein